MENNENVGVGTTAPEETVENTEETQDNAIVDNNDNEVKEDDGTQSLPEESNDSEDTEEVSEDSEVESVEESTEEVDEDTSDEVVEAPAPAVDPVTGTCPKCKRTDCCNG